MSIIKSGISCLTMGLREVTEHSGPGDIGETSTVKMVLFSLGSAVVWSIVIKHIQIENCQILQENPAKVPACYLRMTWLWGEVMTLKRELYMFGYSRPTLFRWPSLSCTVLVATLPLMTTRGTVALIQKNMQTYEQDDRDGYTIWTPHMVL